MGGAGERGARDSGPAEKFWGGAVSYWNALKYRVYVCVHMLDSMTLLLGQKCRLP
jgi:hypothetical protein